MVWKFFDWAPLWQAFYIEHIVSNINWSTYTYGLWHMLVAVIAENTYQSYLGLFVYLMLAWIFAFGEWYLGTDAIRYLDNDFYTDEYLYPSLLYLFGLMEHEHKPED